MEPVLTPEEMATADRRAIAAGTPEALLIERAGRAIAAHAVRLLGGRYGRRIVIVSGKGNNGADGRVAAALLRARGVGVDAYDLASGVDGIERAVSRADLAIDAMFGTGFRGALEADAARVAHVFRDVRTLAVDIPSGVDGATGEVRGDAVQAVETVCFAAWKPGLLFEPGRSRAGHVHVVDIGIDVGVPQLGVTERVDLALPVRDASAHKWSAALLVFGGSTGMTGAPMLAARAAARTGAGMVVCGLPGAAAAVASGGEIVTRALPATPDGHFDEEAARVVLKDVTRFGALAVGPGLGRDDRAQAACRRLIAEAAVPIVVDADALNALAIDPAALRVRHAAGFPRPVLTPHAGEYERLAGRPVGADRVAAARDLAGAAERRRRAQRARDGDRSPGRHRGRQPDRYPGAGDGRDRRRVDRCDRGPARSGRGSIRRRDDRDLRAGVCRNRRRNRARTRRDGPRRGTAPVRFTRCASAAIPGRDECLRTLSFATS